MTFRGERERTIPSISEVECDHDAIMVVRVHHSSQVEIRHEVRLSCQNVRMTAPGLSSEPTNACPQETAAWEQVRAVHASLPPLQTPPMPQLSKDDDSAAEVEKEVYAATERVAEARKEAHANLALQVILYFTSVLLTLTTSCASS